MNLVQHLSAPNDINGNPRRLYLVTNTETLVTDAIDEGYAGKHGRVPADAHELPDVAISASEYNRLCRAFGID